MSHLSIDELSILLLEPSQTQRRIITSRLSEAGNGNVECVATPEQAWSSMTAFVPDLVISSMYLDHMTGSELLLKMRQDEKLKDAPFMLISSETRYENLESLKQAGVMAILPKPFKVEDLKMALQTTADYIDPDEFSEGDLCAEDLRVLIVDDSLTARKHISKMLMKMGMDRISLANDGIEAVRIMEESVFDIVITDFNMPEMDGEKLTSYIRNNSSQSTIPILMITSEHDEARLNSVMKSGVSAICDKPFDVAHIRGLLAQLLS